MAISVERNRKVYTADGSEDTFQYDFKIFVDSDMTVLTVDAITQVETTETAYTVTGAGDENGGNVVFTTPPTINTIVVLWGTYNFKQETEFADGDSFPAVSIENGLDKCTCQNIRQFDEINRALKMSVAYTGDDIFLPYPQGGKIIGWNDAGTQFIYYDTPIVYRDQAAVSAAAALVSQNAAAGSASDAATSALDSSNYATTSLGHSNTSLAHANDSLSYATTASGFADDASDYADLAKDWASASGVVGDGFYSARIYALQAYQTVNSGVEPPFETGTKAWFYQSIAPLHWSIIAATGDRLLATATYASTAGGNMAGSWISTGYSSNSTGAHTHTMANHTHTGPSHTHTGPSHTHTGVDHYHSLSAHTHTYDHYHFIADHSHTINSHSHSVSSANGSVAAVAPEASYVSAVLSVSSPTGGTGLTTNGASAGTNTGWNSATGYYTTAGPSAASTGAADRALTTGAGGTGATSAGGTAATGAPNTNTSDSNSAHSHTISHTGADRPAACVGIICQYDGAGT